MGNGITKQQSKIIKGLAILLMIYHHLFVLANAGIYEDQLSFINISLVTTVAYFGKICVSLFAFSTGYAVYRSMQSIDESLSISYKNSYKISDFLKESYNYSIKHIARLYLYYIGVLLIFVPISVFSGARSFHELSSCNSIFSNILCIKNDYDGSVWYIPFYAFMMLVAPIMHLFFMLFKGSKSESSKKRYLSVKSIIKVFLLCICLAITILICITLSTKNPLLSIRLVLDFIKPSFLLVYIVGYLSARFGVFEFLDAKIFAKLESSRTKSLINLFIGLSLSLSMFILRAVLADSPAYATLDFIIAPIFIFGVLLITSKVRFLANCLAFFGDYSTIMWLTHIHLLGLLRGILLTYVNSHILFYIIIVLLSLIVSILFTKLIKHISVKY